MYKITKNEFHLNNSQIYHQKSNFKKFNLNNDFRIFEIYRFNKKKSIHPWIQYYVFPKSHISGMVLTELIQIQNILDQTLSFRRSCREGICGSCAMNIDGINTLACIHRTDLFKNKYKIYPLSHFIVIKDLIVSLKNFYNQHKLIEPYSKNNNTKFNSLTKQHKLERMLLNNVYECILCACCSSSCPSYWWNNTDYLGPAILLQAYRWISDSKDLSRYSRLSQLNESFKLYRCHTIMNCTETCPKNLNPAQSIFNLKKMIDYNIINKQLKYNVKKTI